MTPPSHRRRRVPTAVMGTGQWGRNLVRVLASLESATLSWVVDPDPVALEKAGELAPRARRVAHIGDTGYDFEAVVICTPTIDHFEHAADLIAKDKQVLVEKPLAMSTDRAAILTALAEERKVALMVGHQLLFHPAFVRMKALISAGSIGRVRTIEAERVGQVDLSREPGVIWEYGPHDISMILSLTGESPLEIRTVAPAPPGSKARPSTADFALDFPSGPTAKVHLATDATRRSRLLTVRGTEGTLVFDDTRPGGTLTRIDSRKRSRSQSLSFPSEEPLRLECLHFIDCILKGAPPLTGPEHAVEVTRVLEQSEAQARSD